MLFICSLQIACSNAKVISVEEAEKPPKPLPRVTDRQSNPNGSVIIVEYHRIAKQEARWDRSVDKFKQDLKRFYDMGFRPVLLTDYLNNSMNLPPGASPIVITFDDSDISQFRMLEDGSIDPDSAIGIWQEFTKQHPDFPIKATFYILPPTPWGQAKWLEEKLKLLKQWGCELGTHTYTHANLSKLTDEQVKEELAKSMDFINDKGFNVSSIALPYGISPKNPNLLKSFIYKGKNYTLESALLVGAGPAPPPNSERLNPFRLPRIQAIDEPYGITFWLDKIQKGEVQVYVAP